MFELPSERHVPSSPSEPSAGSRPTAAAVARPPGDTIAVPFILRAVRRHPAACVLLAVVTAAAAAFALQSPPIYQATAVLRLAGERRTVSAGMEDAAPMVDRHVAPVLSLVPMLQSRTLLGMVVDSLGLQLHPVPRPGWRGGPGPSAFDLGLQQIRVGPRAPGDTIRMRFDAEGLVVRQASGWGAYAYGQPVAVGDVTFVVPEPPRVAEAALAVIPRDMAVDDALGHLAVVPVTGTDAIQVHYTDGNPAVAQQVANLIVESFQSGTVRASQETARRRRLFLADQLEETDRLLTKAQADLSLFRSRQRLASSSEELAMRQAALMALDDRRGEMEANRRVYQSLLKQLESTDDSTRVEGLRSLAYSPEIATDPIVGRLYQQLLVYRTRLDSLSTGPWRASSTNPDVVQLNQLVSSSQEELALAVRARLRSLDERVAAFAAMRSQQSSQLQALPALEAEESRLSQQVAALSTLADQLRLEHQKSRMSEQLAASDVEIVDLAALPYSPSGVPSWVKVAFALFFGLAAGVGVSVLLEIRNRSIRAPEELKEMLPVPGLAIIPPLPEASPRHAFAALRQRLTDGSGARERATGLVQDSQSPSAGAEAFRLLYSSLLLSWKHGQRTILVTSTAPQEGKTLVASNLAVTFAREGARVLLIDCDLRRPRLHRVFGLPRAPGLIELLTARALPPALPPRAAQAPSAPASFLNGYSMDPALHRQDAHQGFRPVPKPPADSPPVNGGGPTAADWNGSWTRSIRSTAIEGLSVIPCGTLNHHPAEVLKAGNMRRLLAELGPRYDLIILDTPPVLVSADAPILAPLADDVLMVIRAGQTDREAVERAYEQLSAAGASIVGTVLNDPGGEALRNGKLYYSYDYPAVAD
jgi:Mrp family chromosome partitioning ATPase/uncharacterized protein involved in exopolysaccharide biosynthesis